MGGDCFRVQVRVLRTFCRCEKQDRNGAGWVNRIDNDEWSVATDDDRCSTVDPPKNLFQILVIQTYCRGDDGVGGGEDGYEVQSIEDHSIADGEAFSLADKGDAGAG